MRRKARNRWVWHPVPFAIIPACYGGTWYWLEQPPWERKLWCTLMDDYYDYRRVP